MQVLTFDVAKRSNVLVAGQKHMIKVGHRASVVPAAGWRDCRRARCGERGEAASPGGKAGQDVCLARRQALLCRGTARRRRPARAARPPTAGRSLSHHLPHNLYIAVYHTE